MSSPILEKNFLISFKEDQADEYTDIPIDISDIINVCREYNKLGWKIQSQIECLLDNGVDDSIKNGIITKESLPQIKHFLKSISRNAYFGDSCAQSDDLILKIDKIIDLKTSDNFN